MHCLQGKVLDSRSVNQSLSRRQKRNWTTPSLSDVQILNTVFWPHSSDTNKGFNSLWHPGCLFFQHLGNTSVFKTAFIIHHYTYLNFLPIHHTSALTVVWTSQSTPLHCVLACDGLTCPQVSVQACQRHELLLQSENLGLLRSPSSSLFHPLSSVPYSSNFHLATKKN